jgi:hypothetical protein
MIILLLVLVVRMDGGADAFIAGIAKTVTSNEIINIVICASISGIFIKRIYVNVKLSP